MNEPGRSLIPEVMMSVFVLIAFLGGAVSITSPCTLPLLPPFIAFMVASSATENRLAFESPTLRVAARATLFMTGVLFIFWASANPEGLIGAALLDYKGALTLGVGIFILGLGIRFTIVSDPGTKRSRRERLILALPAGLAFGLISFACCLGRIISAVLMTDSSVNRNILLLFYFGGLGLIFLIAALVADKLQSRQTNSKETRGRLRRIMGGLLIFVGVLVISGAWTEMMFELQRYAVTTQTLPVRLEQGLLEAFDMAR